MSFQCRPFMQIRTHLFLLAFFLCAAPLHSQRTPATTLDPTRDLPAVAEPAHAPLPAEYIWTANDITVRRPDHNKFPWNRPERRVEPHFFRAHFHVADLPDAATIYIAGPREAHVYLNGKLLGDFTSNVDAPINFHVFHSDAASALRRGDNVLAIEAVRGRGVVTAGGPITTAQLAYGEVLAAKLVPAAFGVEASPLVFTNKSWRSSSMRAEHWQETDFNDLKWPTVDSLGPIESNVDFFQWNVDAGMYGWPGYRGMSPWLRTYTLPATKVSHVFSAHSQLSHIDSLTAENAEQPFTVTLLPAATDADSPSLLLDFGREVAGRLLVKSACNCIATLSIAYGESEIEAMSTGLTPGQRGGNYLGTNVLEVPANGTARGPKSAFRYVRITFLRGAPITAFRSIQLEGIYYPVTYAGSFESSDPLLNKIWLTGAYTAHLSMQDGVWDAPKRDRGRWVGDIDVSGRVISTVFADKFLLEDTLRRLADATPPDQYVNGIASYTALWITSLYNLNLHTGDHAFLASQHETLLRLLARMDKDLDANGLLVPSSKGWGFVDWAPGLYGTTPETRIGTNLQYLRAYLEAPSLLREIGDTVNAARYEAQAERVAAAARRAYLSNGTVGATWQLNTLAVLTGLPSSDNEIWSNVLSHVKQDSPTDPVISPYFNAYLLDALSRTGHDAEALEWIRQYWGGMLAEGATSFWESYDLRWPKTDFHLSLQADGTSGYFVSLAHGWSAGPTAWLSENVLGITPTSSGYDTVEIHPHLLGLEWAHGAVPTPHGLIKISIDKQKGITLDLPAGIHEARVAISDPDARIFLNGTAYKSAASGYVILTSPGQYRILGRNLPQSGSSATGRR